MGQYEPDPRIVYLVEHHGASKVGTAFALDGDSIRRYIAGVSKRTNRWWLEAHVHVVWREFGYDENVVPMKR